MLHDNSRSNAQQRKAEAKQFERRGLLQQSFAKRSIDDSMMENLIRILNEIKVGNTTLEIELIEYVLSLASSLHLLGTLGLSPIYSIRDTLVLEELEKNGIKLWLVSEESERVNKVDYEAMDLYDNYLAPLKIKGTNERKVEESIKKCLKELT